MKALWLICISSVALFAQIQMNDAQINKMGITVQEVRLVRSDSMGPLIGMIEYSDKGAKNYTVGSEASVIELHKHKGDRVVKDQILAKIASSELLSALYEINDLKSRLKITQDFAKKDAQLYQEGVIALRESQKSALEVATLKMKIRELEGRFIFAGADMKVTDGMGFVIRAKQNGVLAQMPQQAGEKIDPFKPYMKIVSGEKLTAFIKISPKHIESVRVGSSVVDAGGKVIGKITSFTSSVDSLNNSATAMAELNTVDPKYRAGGSGEFYITAPTNEKWVLLPRSALSKYKKSDICFVKTSKGFEPKAVMIKKIYKDHIAVASNGFAPSTKVATSGIITLKGVLSGMGFE